MDNQLITPNFHAALLHLPFGLFAIGMLVEIFSFLYPGGGARKAARWMIALGVLLMIPVALSGVYALSDIVRRSMPPGEAVDQPWLQLIEHTQLHNMPKTTAGDPQGEQWRQVLSHAWKMSVATAVAVIAVVAGIACSPRWWRRLYVPIGVVLLASLAWMCWGGWSGGEMVYKWGTGVESNMHTGAARPPPMPSAAMEQTEVRSRDSVAYYAPPLQTHVVIAGLAAAFSLGALGLALRNTARPQPIDIADEMFTSASAADVAMLRSFKPAAAVVIPLELRPAARTWVAGGLFALSAAVLGFWFLATATDAFNFAKSQQRPLPAVLWDTVKTPVDGEPKASTATTQSTVSSGSAAPANPLGLNRRLAHVIAGTAIVVVPLLLAIFAKWSPQRRLPIVLLSMILIVAISVQVWLGVLMLFDGPAGHVVMLRQ